MYIVCVVVFLAGDLESASKVHVFKSRRRSRKGTKRNKGGRRREALGDGLVGHVGCILTLAVSSDRTYLVSEMSILHTPV